MKGLLPHRRMDYRQARGITIAMLALFIVVLFIVAALAIDIGVLYTARTSAQHAADAAALAGAYTFVQNPTASAATIQAAATTAATNAAAQNSILGDPVSIAPSDVVVDTTNRRVTVTVSRLAGSGITTFFAKVIGINTVGVQTVARAEVATGGGVLQGSGSMCLKPIYMPNTALSANPPATACNKGETIFDSSGKLTTFALASLGQTVTVRPLGGGSSIVPSQWGSLDFGSGASTYKCSIENCVNECGISPSQVSCGTPFTVETGNMDGPTSQGFQTLIGSPADQWQGIGEYVSGGVVQDTSRSLVPVVVWNNCTQTISSGKAGQTVNAIGFASVFITGVGSGAVNGRFVYAAPCSTAGGSGGGGGGGSGGGTGPQGVAVRLVQTP